MTFNMLFGRTNGTGGSIQLWVTPVLISAKAGSPFATIKTTVDTILSRYILDKIIILRILDIETTKVIGHLVGTKSKTTGSICAPTPQMPTTTVIMLCAI